MCRLEQIHYRCTRCQIVEFGQSETIRCHQAEELGLVRCQDVECETSPIQDRDWRSCGPCLAEYARKVQAMEEEQKAQEELNKQMEQLNMFNEQAEEQQKKD